MPKSKQTGKIGRLLSLLTGQPLPSQGQSLPVPAKLSTRCGDLMMDKFIDVVCDNDLSALVLEGEATPEQLAAAWTNIWYEYCDLCGNEETALIPKLAYDLKLMQLKYEFASGWVKILSVIYDESIAASLREIGYDYEFSPDTLASDLARVKAELIFLGVRLKVKKAEFEIISERKPAELEHVERIYFAKIFHAFSAYYKYQWNPKTTTVEQYCMAMRDLSEVSQKNKAKK